MQLTTTTMQSGLPIARLPHVQGSTAGGGHIHGFALAAEVFADGEFTVPHSGQRPGVARRSLPAGGAGTAA
jgi:hypothetical protein